VTPAQGIQALFTGDPRTLLRLPDVLEAADAIADDPDVVSLLQAYGVTRHHNAVAMVQGQDAAPGSNPSSASSRRS
jgi:hypothetical protein